MASPPFNINQALPGDTDIASQHPANARTFRDVVESWLLVEGNTNGRSNQRAFDWVADPTGVASVTTIWADSNGYIKFRRGTGDIMYLEDAPGTVKNFAGSTAPNGWLLAYGQAVSRTTYAALFAAIGTTYGTGDGSTTFNLPDVRGRTEFGKDDMGGSAANRITNAVAGFHGETLGATGGAQSVVLIQANLPNLTNLAVTITAGQGSHQHFIANNNSGNNGGVHTLTSANYITVQNASGADAWNYLFNGDSTVASVGLTSATTLPGMTGTAATGGSDTAVNKVPPAIVFNKIIKY